MNTYTQDKELDDARHMAHTALETSRQFSGKSKEDEAEIERLNHEIVAAQEKRLSSEQDRMRSERSQVYICTYAYMNMYVCLFVFIYVCACMCVYIYIYTYMYMYICMYIYI